MDLSIRQVRAFATVVELGSFTRAAAALHLSQPALTVQIRSLEETLGGRLLDRHSRGVALTRFGHDLLPSLQRTLQDVQSVLHDARELGSGTRGTVRIASLPSFAASLLPGLIRQSRRERPALVFELKDAVASAVNELVRSEAVDIGLTGGDLAENDLEVVQRAKDRLCLVFPKDHPIAAKRRLTIKEIATLPMVLTASGTSIRAVVDAAFERAGRTPQLSSEPTYMMTAVAMVNAGLGVTILPGSAREIRAEPGLRMRPIDESSFVRPIALIKKRGRTLPPAASAFLARCVTALREF